MTTSQSSGEATYRLQPDVRIRPLPEWAGALVYTPHSPNLCYLNTTSWTVLELCVDSTPSQLEDSFIEFTQEASVEADEARHRLSESVSMLLAKKIIALDETGPQAAG